MNLNLSSALFLALVSGATAVKHETSTQAKVQPVELIIHRTVLKGALPLHVKQVFVDTDDDKKTDNNDDKKDKDDDDDKSKDDDDKKSRNSSLPECTTNGVNYNRCDPATMKQSDVATCNSIKNGVCGSNMKSSDMDYCTCIGLNGHAVVTSADFRPVLKGTGPSKQKQVFMGLEKDDGGKTDDGNKNTDDKGTDDKKTDDSATDDKKNDDNGTDDKTNDNGIDDTKDQEDDDKNRKDDDDKNKDDDDDDKKNKDDDDDDDDKSRNNNLPECITGGKNYLRCDPDTMNPTDAATCTSIKNEVCGDDMNSVDKSYCECIGLVEQLVISSLHAHPMLKGRAPLRHKQVLLDLDKDDDGGKGGGNHANKSAGSDDDKKNVNTSDDKNNKNDDDDDKKRNNDDDDEKKNKDDDDDDKKNEDDDDDDKKSRNNSVPECVTGGNNYLRCSPATMKSSDKATCDSIKQQVCGKDISSLDKTYCECIGLDGKASAQLRGAVSAPF